MERLSARIIAANQVLSEIFHYTGRSRGPGGRFMTSPDFIANEMGRTRLLDITTDSALSAHTGRVLAPYTDYLTYPGKR